MKLKSLLLGSAAALVAFSGARAADAVIAEPEPVEYVRVCDAYGAGYFYIPGTETCLKIGGFVRYQIDVTDVSDTWGKTTQFNLSFSAKSDTELGTLEGFAELTSSRINTTGYGYASNNHMEIDSAYISLGGLKMGFYDNAFDGGIGGENDGLGGNKGNTISYTFASGGFDATIGLDEAQFNSNFVPNVSANAGFSAGAVAVRGFIAYDEEVGETAVKLRVGADVTEGGRLEAALVYSTDPNYSWNASEWSIAASYSQKVSDKVSVSVGAQYWSGVNGVLVAGGTNGVYSGADGYSIGANVDWTPVTNFLVRAQVQYVQFDGATAADPSTDGVAARLRFQRSF
jgi:Porin subfamily